MIIGTKIHRLASNRQECQGKFAQMKSTSTDVQTIESGSLQPSVQMNTARITASAKRAITSHSASAKMGTLGRAVNN